MKDSLSKNLERKIALCERAEALKDSTEWRKAADEFVAMQKEWKTIGAVAKKHSDRCGTASLQPVTISSNRKRKYFRHTPHRAREPRTEE